MTDETEYGLLMPFVVCQPEGPYDNAAYVAGYEAAGIDQALQRLAAERFSSPLAIHPIAMVHTANVPQVDLIAMRHGYETFPEPIDGMEDEWVEVTFKPVSDHG